MATLTQQQQAALDEMSMAEKLPYFYYN